METVEELRKWVESLSVGELRSIKSLGNARARSQGSQQIDLLDWLRQPASTAPPLSETTFHRNLPTISTRLKELILDGLRLAHKGASVNAELYTALANVTALYEKQLFPPALRLLKRAKKLALEHSSYTLALSCLEWEQKIAHHLRLDRSEALHAEESALLQQRAALQDLKYRHELLVVRARQDLVPRNPEDLVEIRTLASAEPVARLSESGAYLERALATNILGIKDLFERQPLAALRRYAPLLQLWRTHPEWQIEHGALLIVICNCYQMACFHSPMPWEEVQRYLAVLPDFEALTPQVGRDLQRKLYNTQFSLALNTGNFEAVHYLVPEIDGWLRTHQAHIPDTQVLAFLHNFAVAAFLQGHFAAAKRFVARIHRMPNRDARRDIREFALVLQAVLHYELGDDELNAYLTRAGRRHFAKHTREMAFELAVFKHLEVALRAEDPGKVRASLGVLVAALDGLAEQVPGTVPLLGLMEMRLWAKAKQEGVGLQEVFLRAVKANLEALG